MLSELTRLKDEATRLLALYELYKDSDNEHMRRKVHVDIDKFLMQNRETAMVLAVQGLQDAFDREVERQRHVYELANYTPWYKKLFGGRKHAESDDKVNSEAIDNV